MEDEHSQGLNGGEEEEEEEERDGRNQGVASGSTIVTDAAEDDPSISDDDQREIVRRHHPRVTNALPDALRRAGLLTQRFHDSRPQDQGQHESQLQRSQQIQQQQTPRHPLPGSPTRTYLQPQPHLEPQPGASHAGVGNAQEALQSQDTVGTAAQADSSGQPS